MKDLNRIQIILESKQIKKFVQSDKKDFCKMIYKGTFDPSEDKEIAEQFGWNGEAGILITATAEHNPSNPKSNEDGCVATNYYFFKFLKGNLILDRVVLLP